MPLGDKIKLRNSILVWSNRLLEFHIQTFSTSFPVLSKYVLSAGQDTLRKLGYQPGRQLQINLEGPVAHH